ncbi:MAG: hypothetical protein SFU98_03485 [Leptospiraceae bacterium]|nr:hypothetical protein [Leptospiraceae bacterium]
MSLSTINLEAKKLELIAQITRIIDYDTLVQVEKILATFDEDTKHWKNLSKQEKLKIEKGLLDIKKGKVISNSSVKKKIDKYIQEM